MKKIFLIPLMAMLCTVMAWGKDAHVSTIADLNAKLADASIETIYLDNDVTYATNETVIWVKRSVTIDGQNHTISGYGKRGARYVTISIYPDEGTYTAPLNVTLKNIKASHNAATGRSLELFHYDSNVELNIDNCEFRLTGSGNNQGVTVESTHTTVFNISNSTFYANNSGYPLITFSPLTLNLTNSNFAGYCALYFKAGSANSIVNANACNFDAPNVHSGTSNAFAVFPMEDTPMTFNLNNCGMNAEQIGDQGQPVFCLSEWTKDANRAGQVNITLSGDNTHINCETEWIWNSFWYPNTTGTPDYNSIISTAEAALHVNVNAQITGGTYSVDPREMIYWNDQYKDGEGYHYNLGHITIPDGYEVKEITMEGVATPLYRVVKKAQEKTPGVMYDLNDFVPVEGEGYGDNPVSSFDLSTGTDMTLNQETTTAGYVQVSDKGDDATVIKVGKVVSEEKVDQTLVINNGLDVQGNSKVEVQAGSTLQIGEGGINTESSENIVIEADEDGAGSLLLDPTITVNQTPNLTVKMLAKQIGRDASGDFFWHRFAMPVLHIENWDKEGTLEGKGSYVVTYPTYVYAWDYDENDWKNIAPKAMIPLKGYTLTLASDYIHMDGDKVESEGTEGGNLNVLQDVYYTFKGNLVGNTDQALKFEKEGFNFFGNSYTGYMDALTVINGIESEHVDNTIYMWNSAEQTYSAVGKYKLENEKQRKRLADWQKEIAPMQTFILRLRGADDADESVSYADAIWGNPRYGNPAPAPARLASADEEDAYLEIKVTAANGKSDKVDFTEMASKSDAFESAYDAEKYMNRNSLNLYADVEGINLSSVVTDDLIGKTLSMQTVNEVNYTMTFANVEGNEYALLDKATNEVIAITNDAVYTFSAQPNSTVENRFEIVAIAKAPTAVENTESSVKARGIYTMLGQYMGEDITVLPAGVYVVNGVKIVK